MWSKACALPALREERAWLQGEEDFRKPPQNLQNTIEAPDEDLLKNLRRASSKIEGFDEPLNIAKTTP